MSARMKRRLAVTAGVVVLLGGCASVEFPDEKAASTPTSAPLDAAPTDVGDEFIESTEVPYLSSTTTAAPTTTAAVSEATTNVALEDLTAASVDDVVAPATLRLISAAGDVLGDAEVVSEIFVVGDYLTGAWQLDVPNVGLAQTVTLEYRLDVAGKAFSDYEYQLQVHCLEGGCINHYPDYVNVDVADHAPNLVTFEFLGEELPDGTYEIIPTSERGALVDQG